MHRCRSDLPLLKQFAALCRNPVQPIRGIIGPFISAKNVINLYSEFKNKTKKCHQNQNGKIIEETDGKLASMEL